MPLERLRLISTQKEQRVWLGFPSVSTKERPVATETIQTNRHPTEPTFSFFSLLALRATDLPRARAKGREKKYGGGHSIEWGGRASG